jgi:hypothetical protein
MIRTPLELISAVQRDGMSMVARSGVSVVEISIKGEAGSAPSSVL